MRKFDLFQFFWRERCIQRCNRYPRRLIGWFETLESRLALFADSIDGRPFIDMGPSDNVAWDQPRVTVQFITGNDQIVGPNTFSTWLLDTGANTILGFQAAVNDMNESPPLYTTEGVFEELGVGGTQTFDISSPYQFDFAGTSGVRNTLLETRIISDDNTDLSIFGPWGIVGMPAMADRVTTFDFTNWTTVIDFDLFMHVEFSETVPDYSGPRYSVPVDNRVFFEPEGQVVSGNHPPVWADIPFLTAQLVQNDHVVEGNFLFDSGAQVSILSSAMAIELGLDSNLDGILNERDANFARQETVGGIGGFKDVPVFLIDEVHVPTEQGADLVWTDVQWLVLDIHPGIDAVFGFDNITSGWIEAFGVDGQSGYIMQTQLDFRDWTATGQGTIEFDINPEIFALVDPNGPGAIITENGGSTGVSETGITDTYQIALSKPPLADVTVSLVSTAGQVTAVDALNPNNHFLVFTSANWSDPRTVQVSAVNDDVPEGFQRSFIKHVSTSSDPAYQGAGMPRIIVNIVDDDFAGAMIIPSNGSTDVSEGGATDTYDLVLTHPTTQNVMIELQNASNQVTAVSASTGSRILTFTPANWNVPQTVKVTAVDDQFSEGKHRGYITHQVSTGDTEYQQAFVLQEVAQITDNDSLDNTAPTVTNVIVGSTSWSTGFIDAVDGGGMGAGNGKGLSLPGPGQLTNLTQTNINKIYVAFSENVSPSFTSANVKLVGTNVANYNGIATFAYGVDGPNIGTITLATPISSDSLILSIFTALSDVAGNAIDGEWVNGVSSVSGNGTAGGQFNFQFDVLPGDVTNSNGVTTSDFLLTHSKNNTIVGTNADAMFDINGNGGVTTSDFLLVNSKNNTVLPATPPAPVSSLSVTSAGFLQFETDVSDEGLLVDPDGNSIKMESTLPLSIVSDKRSFGPPFNIQMVLQSNDLPRIANPGRRFLIEAKPGIGHDSLPEIRTELFVQAQVRTYASTQNRSRMDVLPWDVDNSFGVNIATAFGDLANAMLPMQAWDQVAHNLVYTTQPNGLLNSNDREDIYLPVLSRIGYDDANAPSDAEPTFDLDIDSNLATDEWMASNFGENFFGSRRPR